MAFTQDNRLIRIALQNLEPDTLLLAAVTGQEAISRPFNYRVEMLCEDLAREIDPAQMINSSATIGIRLDETGEYRFRSGFIRHFQAGNVRREFRVFRAEIVPFLSFLQLSTDFRIFQNLTVVDILEQVFAEFGLNDLDMSRVHSDDYPKLEYCVQCRETAFDFVSRLMEENGIFYYFLHSEQGHTLVLGDDLTDYGNCEQSNIGLARQTVEGRIAIFEHGFDFRTGKWVIGDFSYATPAAPIFDEEPTRSQIPRADPHRRYAFPQHLQISQDARRFVLDRMQEEEAAVAAVSANSTLVTFAPGLVFRVSETTDIPYQEEDRSYLVTSLTWTAFERGYRHNFLDVLLGAFGSLWSGDIAKTLGLGPAGNAAQNATAALVPQAPPFLSNLLASRLGGVLSAIPQAISGFLSELFAERADFQNQFMAIPADVLFRPPRTTPKPRIHGPHTALVVGPAGLMPPGGNDIATDQYGRVRVKFPWDRSTEHDSHGETSAWIRVAESWAGSQWGSQFPPRVGQEVIVDFIDGDPDRPIITGRLYNGVFRQPLDPPGQTVGPPPAGPLQPQDSHIQSTQRRSGIKTQSTPHPEGARTRFHLLRFDDNWEQEQIVLRSQHRLDVTAFQSAYHTTHANRHILVGGKDPDTGEGGGALYVTTGGEYDLHIGDNRYEGVDKGYQLSVKADTIFDLEGNHQTIVGRSATLNAMNIVIEGSLKITLKVGSSFVVLDPAGVYITGPMVQINSGGSPGSTGNADVTDPEDAVQADPGDPPNFLAQHHPDRGGGGRRHHTAVAHHGLNVSRNSDGSFQVTPGVRVRGTPAYVSAVIGDLATIDATADGHARLGRIDGSGHQVTIQNYDASHPKPASPNADTVPGNGAVVDYANAGAPGSPAGYDAAGNPVVFGNGHGSDSNIHYDPADWPDPTSRTKAPGDAILNHELGHADNQTHGRQDMTSRPDNYGDQEEFNNLPNDNSYRRERGIPERRDYADF